MRNIMRNSAPFCIIYNEIECAHDMIKTIHRVFQKSWVH